MRSMRNSFRSVFLLCLLMLLLTGCRLTDHSEKDPDAITADGLNFPKSGFENVDPAELPKVEFEETHLDLGEIVQGAKVERTFTFENTGGSALVISDVRGSSFWNGPVNQLQAVDPAIVSFVVGHQSKVFGEGVGSDLGIHVADGIASDFLACA